MPVESASFISQLNTALPGSLEPKNEGDNHLRLIKQVLKNTFPQFNSTISASSAQIQAAAEVIALGGSISGQLNVNGALTVQTSIEAAGDITTPARIRKGPRDVVTSGSGFQNQKIYVGVGVPSSALGIDGDIYYEIF